MKPIEDTEFARLVDNCDGWMAPVKAAKTWLDARDALDGQIAELEDKADRLRAAADHAHKKYEASATPEDKPTTGWRCSNCKTGTLSRCRDCDEPTCGNCLAVHVCVGVMV